ncbi:META domain-containing protein [Marinobacter bryozoorum]|jgi:heat shock protein HslJ|uniref:META domain-containing protein n=1 Tax=Marinobacter bryozoorum TaxID=256324 RepID=UPI002002D46C|nr:META domain-containing protein [Marinobacter bryozoorum]MCK7544920.1 META domain-containing protein [Marinobacter bryozoorum]
MNGMSVAGRIIVLGCLALLAACASGPGSQQGGPVPTAPLTNTYWKLMELQGNAVDVPQGEQGEPHMIFRDDGKVNGFSGCNRFVGEYTVTGANLLFDSMASTRMACPDDSYETVLYDVFADTAGVFLEGKVLKLLDDQGHGLARFEAVALP